MSVMSVFSADQFQKDITLTTQMVNDVCPLIGGFSCMEMTGGGSYLYINKGSFHFEYDYLSDWGDASAFPEYYFNITFYKNGIQVYPTIVDNSYNGQFQFYDVTFNESGIYNISINFNVLYNSIPTDVSIPNVTSFEISNQLNRPYFYDADSNLNPIVSSQVYFDGNGFTVSLNDGNTFAFENMLVFNNFSTNFRLMTVYGNIFTDNFTIEQLGTDLTIYGTKDTYYFLQEPSTNWYYMNLIQTDSVTLRTNELNTTSNIYRNSLDLAPIVYDNVTYKTNSPFTFKINKVGSNYVYSSDNTLNVYHFDFQQDFNLQYNLYNSQNVLINSYSRNVTFDDNWAIAIKEINLTSEPSKGTYYIQIITTDLINNETRTINSLPFLYDKKTIGGGRGSNINITENVTINKTTFLQAFSLFDANGNLDLSLIKSLEEKTGIKYADYIVILTSLGSISYGFRKVKLSRNKNSNMIRKSLIIVLLSALAYIIILVLVNSLL